jgi:hypothetical protein
MPIANFDIEKYIQSKKSQYIAILFVQGEIKIYLCPEITIYWDL